MLFYLFIYRKALVNPLIVETDEEKAYFDQGEGIDKGLFIGQI